MSANGKPHIYESIRDINENSWLIGGKLLLSRQASVPLQQPPSSNQQPSWSDGNGGFFTLCPVPEPLPDSRPHQTDSTDLPRVYAVGDQSAVWRTGEAFIKARDIRFPAMTREHVTIEFVRTKGPRNFEVPRVLYHGEFDGHYFIVVSRVPGQTLAEAWPHMSVSVREEYADRVADACLTMAEWKGETLGGVDGRQLTEYYLAKVKHDRDNNNQRLLDNCVAMGMDTSSFVFYHCDLGPGNIIVDPARGSLGIIDWEIAGFVPKEWVKTKFRLSSGMDFEVEDQSKSTEWRRMVIPRLAERGFTDVLQAWLDLPRKF